jgi:hypothetical protein
MNFENPSQMGDATLAHLLGTYSTQSSSVGQQLYPPEFPFSAQNVDQEADREQQFTKVEQPFPDT